MHIKEFFDEIEHRFRNARVLDDNMVQADLIDWSDEYIGKMLYEIKDTQQVKGIECYIGDITYAWGQNISDAPTQPKTFNEILSILRGLLESRNQVEIITDTEANVLIESAKQTSSPITSIVEPYKNSTKEYHVTINATFSGVVNSTTMDRALVEIKDRLKFLDHVQYKINSESVEIKY